ncbi:glutathione S-transferase family protein [Xanthomonas arboricola]|uniref:glutathione S-transferase family protein n=1 Tax=Xanthomonas arboricola TaxID=56448 RepID=UPI00168F6662|nr:glutathione S-transferase family protein [Xanthomonas arboricola]NJB78936.1 glutathione S-transferase [Xanthomonas arboricola]
MPNNLTLISHPLCPFVQRAAIVLLEHAVAFERVDIDLHAKPDWFLALSPTGKVPLLRIGQPDGSVATLFESVVICDYLDETSGSTSLYPRDPLQRAQQRAWIEFAAPTFADAWQFLNASDQASADTASAAFRGKLQKLEQALGHGPYFAGPAFGMVDVVFAPLLRYFGLLPAEVCAPIFEGAAAHRRMARRPGRPAQRHRRGGAGLRQPLPAASAQAARPAGRRGACAGVSSQCQRARLAASHACPSN